MLDVGYCSFIIKGTNLDFIEIENNLIVKPSKKYHRGALVSKVIGENQFDVFIIEEKINESTAPNEALDKLIALLDLSGEYLEKLSLIADLKVKCYVQSDFAQVNFILSPSVLTRLANMKIEFEISIIS